MARDKEATLKLKADITGFKKNITTANNEIKKMQEQFKQAANVSKDWANTSSGVENKIKSLGSVLKQQKSILKDLMGQYEATKKLYGENSTQAQNLAVKIEKQKTSITKTEAELRRYNESLEKIKKSENATGIQKLTQEINKQSQALEKAKQKYADYIANGQKHTKEAKQTKQEIKNLSGELETNKKKLADANSQANKFDKSLKDVDEASRGAEQGLSAMDVALGNITARVAEKAFTSIVDFGKNIIQTGIDYESSLAKVQAISGSTGDDLARLDEKAKQMGESTVFSASQSADAMQYMALAGWKTEDMINGIGGVMDLAAASGEDLATVSDIITDGLTAMGLSAQDSSHFADIFAATMANSNTTVGLMGETMKYVGPLAGGLGIEMDDLALSIGLMANAGVKGSQAGTGLSAIINRLATDTGDARQQAEDLGVSIYDSSGNMRDWGDIIDDLRGAWVGLNDEQKASVGKTIAGQEALKGFEAIMNATTGDVDKLRGAISNADGTAGKMADTMNNTLSGSLTLLKSQIEGKMLKVFDKIKPYLEDMVEDFGNFIDSLDWDAIAKGAGEFAKAIGNITKFIIDNRKWLLPLIAGYVSFDKIMNKFSGGTKTGLSSIVSVGKSAVGTLKNLYTGASVTFGGMTSLIGIAAAGFATLAIYMTKQREKMLEQIEANRKATKEWQDYAKANEEANKHMDKANELLEQNAENLNKVRESEENAALQRGWVDQLYADIDKIDQGKLQSLWEELGDLNNVDISKLPVDVQTVIREIENLNNTGLTDLQGSFDETGFHINKTKDEVTELINETLRQAEIEVYKDTYVKEMQAIKETQKALDEKNNARIAKEKEIQRLEDDHQKKYKEWLNDKGKAQGEFKDTAYEENIKKANEELNNLNNETNKYNDQLKQSIRNTSDYKNELEGLMNGTIDVDNATENLIEEVSNLSYKMTNETSDALGELSKQYGTSFDTLRSIYEQYGQEGIDRYTELMTTLNDNSRTKLTELTNNTGVDLGNLVTLFKDKGYDGVEAFLGEFNKLPDDVRGTLNNISTTSGIQLDTIVRLYRDKGYAGITAYIDELSRQGKGNGEMLAKGRELAESANAGVNNNLQKEHTVSINGNSSNIDNVIDEVNWKLQTMTKTQYIDLVGRAVINTPDQYKDGAYFAEKHADGAFFNGTSGAYKRGHIFGEAGKEVALPLTRNLGWADKLADILLGKVSDRVKNINTNNTTQVINNYNQTINSPKQLDTYSIYKNTNKLIKGKS